MLRGRRDKRRRQVCSALNCLEAILSLTETTRNKGNIGIGNAFLDMPPPKNRTQKQK